jgi:hypothetical protein
MLGNAHPRVVLHGYTVVKSDKQASAFEMCSLEARRIAMSSRRAGASPCQCCQGSSPQTRYMKALIAWRVTAIEGL